MEIHTEQSITRFKKNPDIYTGCIGVYLFVRFRYMLQSIKKSIENILIITYGRYNILSPAVLKQTGWSPFVQTSFEQVMSCLGLLRYANPPLIPLFFICYI